MKTARQVVESVVGEWMERQDIERMARILKEREDGILDHEERRLIEIRIGIWEFGKWALLGDAAGQEIKRQLDYQSRVKESPTFWQSIIPMNDDQGCAYDEMISALLTKQQRKAVKCAYQYHTGEEGGARALGVGRYQFRVWRDTGLTTLRDALETA